MKHYLGIDLGGTNIVAGVVDENYKIIAEAKVKTECPRPPKNIMEDMASVAKKAVAEAKLSMDDIEWVGVGCPGTVNQNTGNIEYANNLNFYDVPMRKELTEMLGKEIHIDNDANAAAYGEFVAGAAKGATNAVAITLGTGVGSGIIVGGKIYSGSNFAGAELGHMIINVDGASCTCGRKGCFESYGSATALINSTKEKMLSNKKSLMWKLCDNNLDKVDGKTSFDAMREGDKHAKEVVEQYVSYLGAGLVNIINIFQPEIICIGGGVSREGDNLLVPLREYAKTQNYARFSENQTKIVAAELGSEAGIIGAAMLGNS